MGIFTATETDLLIPGLLKMVASELGEGSFRVEQGFDGVTIIYRGRRAHIAADQFRKAARLDNYGPIATEMRRAARYLKALVNGNAPKYYAFRKKLRSIRARSRQWP